MGTSHRVLSAAGLAALLLSAVACGGAAPAANRSGGAQGAPSARQVAPSKVYSFGAMLVLTGPGAEIGKLAERGVNMAVDAINGSGGAAGWTLKALPVDTRGTAQGGAQAMQQLTNLNHVPFVLGQGSAVDLAAQPIAAQNHILLLNVGGTANEMLNKPWLYNNQIQPPSLEPALASYEFDQGLRTAALLTSEDTYGASNAQVFASVWRKLGGRVVDQETFPLGTSDFTPQLTRIRAAHPQLLFVVALGDTQGLLVKQARALGITAALAGPLATQGLINVAGSAADGFVDVSIAVDPATTDPLAKQFLDAYRAKYGSYPEWDTGVLYEGVQLLADLIREATAAGLNPRSGDALVKMLTAHPSFHNYLSGGTVRILPDHDAVRTLALQRITGNRFVTLKTVQAGASA